MASTYDQANAALRDYGTVFGRVAEEAFNSLKKFKEVDLTSPTALEQINAIQADYKANVPGWNSDRNASRAILEGIYDDLPADGFFSSDKANFRKTINTTVAQYNDLVKQANALKDEMKVAKAALEKAAAEKSETPPEPKQPATTDDAASPKSPEVKQSPSPTDEVIGPTKVNPLSNLSSYIYSITLYMVSPDVMNTFINNGGIMAINPKGPGVYVVAQSGGINNSVERRIPNSTKQLTAENGGIGLDYYIDDLVIESLLPGGQGRQSLGTNMKFKIIEPTSFTFLQDVAKASAKLNQESADLNGTVAALPNGFTQHFIVGIRFYGYDVNGKMVESTDPQFSGYNNGYASDNSVIQRYFCIRFADIKFKLDGKIVTYQCTATITSEQAAYGQMNGTIKTNLKLQGKTVGDVLNGMDDSSGAKSKNSVGLMKVLSDQAEANKDRKLLTLPPKYRVEFLDATGKVDPNSPIAKANLIDDATFVSSSAPMPNKSSVDASLKATSYDNTMLTIPVGPGQPIITVIDNIITKSTYVTNALNSTLTQGTEADGIEKPPAKTFKWYNINPVVKILGVDPQTNNWSYEIVYQIRPYDVAYIRSNYVDNICTYPGPYRMYHHWLTGKNSEIITYEQQYDNLYYTVANMNTAPTTVNSTGTALKQKQSTAPSAPENSGGNTDSTTGGKNKGSQINENVRAQLYSVDNMVAKIKILGDPDYIMTSTGVNNPPLSKFYGKDGSINPMAGQVFIQVVFNMATDYLASGILDVSDQLQFYRTDRVKNAGIDGLVYMVNIVESTFSRGTFTQVLDCLMVDENRLVMPRKKNKETETREVNPPSPDNKKIESVRSTTISSGLSATQANDARANFAKTDPRLIANNKPSEPNDDKNVTKYETPYDRMNRQNREAEAARTAKAEQERATLRENARNNGTASPGAINPNTLLPTRR